MTNEQLAMQAKAGDPAATRQLWEQNRGLLFTICLEFASSPTKSKMMERSGVTIEDLFQVTFFAVLEAIKAYDPTLGYAFTAYLKYPLKNEFFRLVGVRLKRDKNDPLNNCMSLDEYIGDGVNITRGDLTQDFRAQGDFYSVDEKLYYQQLKTALGACMQNIGVQEAEVLRQRFYQGRTLKEIGQDLDISPERVRQLERNGLQGMRKQRRKLESFRNQIIDVQAYHGTSFAAWKRIGSVEERIVERLDNLEKA